MADLVVRLGIRAYRLSVFDLSDLGWTVTSWQEMRKIIGMVLPRPQLCKKFTGLENTCFYAHEHCCLAAGLQRMVPEFVVVLFRQFADMPVSELEQRFEPEFGLHVHATPQRRNGLP